MVIDAFYVYEHWRPDKDVCFWVGKGRGDRAYRFRRNFHYNNVVKKLARLGMCVEVRLVQSALDEPTALAMEVERIAFWRGAGVKLTNYTTGGEGVSGLVHSTETKAKIRAKRAAQKIAHSDATKKKIAAAHLGRRLGTKNPKHGDKLRGRKLSMEHRENIGHGMKGRQVSAETRAKIGAAHRGRIHSTESKENMSRAHVGKRPTDEVRKKMSESHSRRWQRARESI